MVISGEGSDLKSMGPEFWFAHLVRWDAILHCTHRSLYNDISFIQFIIGLNKMSVNNWWMIDPLICTCICPQCSSQKVSGILTVCTLLSIRTNPTLKDAGKSVTASFLKLVIPFFTHYFMQGTGPLCTQLLCGDGSWYPDGGSRGPLHWTAYPSF